MTYERELDRRSIAGHRRKAAGNSQGYRGIYFDMEHAKWRAEIWFSGRRYKLGRFSSPEAAAHAYDCAARKFYGEFAVTNDGQRTACVPPPQSKPNKRIKRRLARFYEVQRQRRENEIGQSGSTTEREL